MLYVRNYLVLLIICLFIYVAVDFDCVWGGFGDWSSCSVTCGGGYRTRTRSVAIPASSGGEQCTGLATETEQCNANACAGSKTIKAVAKIINTGAYLANDSFFL